MPFGETLQILSTVLVAGGLAVWASIATQKWHSKSKQAVSIPRSAGEPVFLFDRETLIDATPTALDLVRRRKSDASEVDGLIHVLQPMFPSLRSDISRSNGDQKKTITSPVDETLSVGLEREGNKLRITLKNSEYLDAALRYKALEAEAYEKETKTQQFICQNAPQLIWQENETGEVTWANKAYLRYADLIVPRSNHTGKAWPNRRLFNDLPTQISKDASPLTTRRSLRLHGQEAEHWFDVTTMPSKEGTMNYAADANDIMRAKESQKAFISTIANTFAQLSIGLAIFDRKRRLASFNPAFSDLTGLPTQFLIGRPSIELVLDRLRETGKLPEPKDYSTFKEQFAALEEEASQGTYIENWELPNGQTYQVTGKPHPDGALAFLFEDVTAEISLTRRFRTEIETGQAVLDNIPDAIAVFSQSNALVISNTAYTELWGDPDLPLAINYDLRTALRRWKTGSVSNMIWRSIESFANSPSDREGWADKIVLKDGRQATCHVCALTGGMTMIKFVLAGRHTPTLQKLVAHDPAIRAHNN